MKLLSALVKTVVVLPVSAAVDVVSLGGAVYGKDRPNVVDALESITDDLDD